MRNIKTAFRRFSRRVPYLPFMRRMLTNSFFRKVYFSNLLDDGVTFDRLGKFKCRINWRALVEIDMIGANQIDSENLQALKLLIPRDSRLLVIAPPSNFVINYLIKTCGCKLEVVTSASYVGDLTEVEHEVAEGSCVFLRAEPSIDNYDAIISYKKSLTVLLSSSTCCIFICDQEFTNVDSGVDRLPYQYLLVRGKLLSIGLNSSQYLVQSRENLVPMGSIYAKGVSGFSLLRTADLYPFDICYESALELVDEFLIFVDADIFKNNDPRGDVALKLVNEYIDASAFPEKIRVFTSLSFNTTSASQTSVPGRWIADVINRITGHCKYDTCLFLMADEMLSERSASLIKNFSAQEDQCAISFKFLHFIYNLETIRSAENAAYDRAIRVFKRDRLACVHDGYDFRPISRSDAEKQIRSNELIYHLGYVLDYKRKAETLTQPGEIFAGSEISGYVTDVDTIKYDGELPKILFDKRFRSSCKLLGN